MDYHEALCALHTALTELAEAHAYRETQRRESSTSGPHDRRLALDRARRTLVAAQQRENRRTDRRAALERARLKLEFDPAAAVRRMERRLDQLRCMQFARRGRVILHGVMAAHRKEYE